MLQSGMIAVKSLGSWVVSGQSLGDALLCDGRGVGPRDEHAAVAATSAQTSMAHSSRAIFEKRTKHFLPEGLWVQSPRKLYINLILL